MTKRFWFSLMIIFLLSVPVAANQGLIDKLESGIGSSAKEQLIARYGGEYFLPIHEQILLDTIFQRLVNTFENNEEYSLTVLNSYHINAFALPGNYIFITRGMLRLLDNNSHAVAFVLGHELAHTKQKHGLNALLRQMGLTILMELGLYWMNASSSEEARIASAALVDIVQAGYGREAEFEADILGQQYAIQAGFDPVGSIYVLKLLEKLENEATLPMQLFRTHPPTKERKSRMKEIFLDSWTREAIAKSEFGELIYTPNSDPTGRFAFSQKTYHGAFGLSGFDNQIDKEFVWLVGEFVKNPSWSPDGQNLIVMVRVEDDFQLWFLNRLGNIVKKWQIEEGVDYSNPVWSPCGRVVAYVRHSAEAQEVWVSYVAEEIDVKIAEQTHAVKWDKTGLIFSSDKSSVVEKVKPPEIVPVEPENPIPKIIERNPRVEPTVIKENSTFRLRRPNILTPLN